ncbi:MAG: DUF4132 domain-containing protein [Deltaproteobacteria bacterium]|nr:DUF4132 domain-containing protein [Deltaproteobacteria bacterium]
MARFEFVEGSSNKFWEIEIDGVSLTTTYGRIGSKGQTSRKTFDSAEKARAEHDKLVKEKTKKGYSCVDARAAVDAASSSAPVGSSAVPATSSSVSVAFSLAHVPVGADVEIRIAPWSPKLAKQVAEDGRLALEVPPAREETEAAALFETLRSRFLSEGKVVLTQGLVRAPQAHKERLSRLIWAYSELKCPATLDVDVEAAALLLFPEVLYGGRLRHHNVCELLIRFWIAHSGLAFALEVFSVSLGAISFASARIPHSFWLADRADRTLRELLVHRSDRILRAHLLGADPQAASDARAKAVELRRSGTLLQRSALASIFLDPAWIEEDIKARLETGDRIVLTELAFLSAPKLEVVSDYFSVMTMDEAMFIEQIDPPIDRPPSNHPSDIPIVELSGLFAPMLLEHRGEAAVTPLSRWLVRVTELQTTPGQLWLFTTINRLIEILERVSSAPEVAKAMASVLSKFRGHRLSKSEDPCPAALAWLRASPAVSLSPVREASRQKNGAWAKDLSLQLERVLGTDAGSTLIEADPEALPTVLRATDGPAKFNAPAFWSPMMFERPKLRSGAALPLSSVNALAAVLVDSNEDAIRAVKESCDAGSLAAFAWDLFKAWLAAGAPPKEKWAFLALGWLGNDESARRLTPLIRAWPGESAHQRAVLGLDVLANIGSDVALMMLNGIAQKLKFKGLQGRAKEKIDEVAKRSGLTAEALEDRLVPDLDLEDDGSKILDFGPRSFRVGFDETLTPFVVDASGKPRKNLPAANAQDDPVLFASATETWKAMKKDARTLASIQIRRLELAMVNERRWKPEAFEALLVHHPLLTHIVRRLVLGTFSPSNALLSTFRVADDRSYANIEDDTFELSTADVSIGVVHPIQMMDADLARWSKIFADHEILQPFEQLARETFRLTEDEREATELSRFGGLRVLTTKLMGLESRDWRRGSPQDAGIVRDFDRVFGNGYLARLDFDSGIMIQSLALSETYQILQKVLLGHRESGLFTAPNHSLDEVPPIVISEVIRDLNALGGVSDVE